MRPIKFRGRVSDEHIIHVDKMVFGYFVRGGNKKPYILVDNPNNNGQSLYQVDEDSVAQFVGYDNAGNEVYEGDKVLRYDNEEEFAETPENGRLVEIPFYTELDSPLDIYYIVKAKEDTQ